MNNETQNATDTTLDDELESLIGDATTVTAVASAEVEAANDEIDLEEIESVAVAQATKEAAYAEQEPEQADPNSNVTPIAAAKTKKSSTPRPSRAAGAKASAVLTSVIKEDDQLLKAAMLVTTDQEDPALVDQLKSVVDGLAKKVGDKAVNLLRNQSEPKKLQNYTRLGLAHLIEEGSTSSKMLTDAFQKAGYTLGTARSQANQLMALLPALKVADKSGKNLTLNADSSIVANFKAAVAASTP